MTEEDPILNDIVKSIVAKGGIVDVYREGRGVLGPFIRIKQAVGTFDYSVHPPVRRLPAPPFWTLYHTSMSQAEMLSKSIYDNLEVRKIQPNVYHVIVPR